MSFLAKVGTHAAARARNVQVLGPAPAAMERKGGRYRAHLLLKSGARAELHALIDESLAAARAWPESRRIRWSVDVDPTEI
jgi:primosomal protein N' (replication factor Y)